MALSPTRQASGDVTIAPGASSSLCLAAFGHYRDKLTISIPGVLDRPHLNGAPWQYLSISAFNDHRPGANLPDPVVSYLQKSNRVAWPVTTLSFRVRSTRRSNDPPMTWKYGGRVVPPRRHLRRK